MRAGRSQVARTPSLAAELLPGVPPVRYAH